MCSPPGTWLMHVLFPSQSLGRLHPLTSPTRRILGPRLRCSPLRLKNASVFGSRDCRLRLQYRFPRHRSCVTVSGRCHYDYGNKLSLTATFSLSPPPLLCRGVGTLPPRCQPETSACYSEPPMMGCGPPSSISRLNHTDSHVPPTHLGGSRQHSNTRQFSLSVCDAY